MRFREGRDPSKIQCTRVLHPNQPFSLGELISVHLDMNCNSRESPCHACRLTTLPVISLLGNSEQDMS